MVGNGYRLCILGDLNGWIDRTRAGITSAFRVLGENDDILGLLKGREYNGMEMIMSNICGSR